MRFEEVTPQIDPATLLPDAHGKQGSAPQEVMLTPENAGRTKLS
jgi:hypothetical protein